MAMMKTRLVSGVCASVLLIGLGGVVPLVGSTAFATVTAHDVTDPAERALQDAVPAPVLEWQECGGPQQQCANVEVPLRYDQPKGPTTRISVLKNPARQPDQRIGALFVNPGGPGGSALRLAAMVDSAVAPVIRDRFDIYGVEPRGIATAQRYECFKDEDEKKAIGKKWETIFEPTNAAQLAKKKELTAKFAEGCQNNTGALVSAISTTNHVRDLELVRRSLKEETISFFGFSYGTAIAQYYGNMFPDKVRALAGDGVVDAEKWVGTANNPGSLDDRLQSSVNAKRTFDKILDMCKNPAEDCRFLSNALAPEAKFAELEKRVTAQPISAVAWGGEKVDVDVPTMYAMLGGLLYLPNAPSAVTAFLEQLWRLSHAPLAKDVREDATRVLAELDRAANPAPDSRDVIPPKYENDMDAYLGVICLDGHHPATFDDYIPLAAASRKKSGGFGAQRVWGTSVCARDHWTGSDPLRYTGPFNKRSKTPMLFIGNDWDPATPGTMAESAAARTPGAGLVTSDDFGHTTSTTSACVANVLTKYLVNLSIPEKPVRCTSGNRRFQSEVPAGPGRRAPWF